MKLTEYKETYEDHSHTLSNINRSIAFAGIAVVWIFKRTEAEKVLIDDEFLFPLLFFIAGLGFDILQYVYQTIAWYIVFRKKEKQFQEERNNNPNSSDEFEHDYSITYPAWTLFSLKILCVIIGFIILFVKLFEQLF